MQAASITFDDIMQLMRAQSDIEIPASDLKVELFFSRCFFFFFFSRFQAALRELEAEEVLVRQGAEGRNPTYLLKQMLQ